MAITTRTHFIDRVWSGRKIERTWVSAIHAMSLNLIELKPVSGSSLYLKLG